MLPIHTILHPTDFSERSEYAFRLANILARDYDAQLIVLHVAPTPIVAYGDGFIPITEPGQLDELKDKLQELAAQAVGIRAKPLLLEGDPAAEILLAAEQAECDLIIMGTHGRTGLGRILLGSVAEEIVRKAACPVLTVKTPFPQTESIDETVKAAEPVHST